MNLQWEGKINHCNFTSRLAAIRTGAQGLTGLLFQLTIKTKQNITLSSGQLTINQSPEHSREKVGKTASAILSAVNCKRLQCDKGNLCQHSARILEKKNLTPVFLPLQIGVQIKQGAAKLFIYAFITVSCFLPRTRHNIRQILSMATQDEDLPKF